MSTVLVLVSFCFVALLLAATNAAAQDIHPQYRIDNPSTHTEVPMEGFDSTSIATADLSGDGVQEIIVHNDNNRLYVFDGYNGDLVAELETNQPDGWNARNIQGPAVGDLTGNGLKDIVVSNSAGWVTAFEAQPTGDYPKVQFAKLWETFLDPHKQDPNYSQNMAYGEWHGFPALDGPVFLADTNWDGRDEVFVQLDDMPSRYKLSPDGHVEVWKNEGDGNAGPLVSDLDGDGAMEAIFPSDGGTITIYDAGSMHHECTFSAVNHGAWPGSISVSPTLADVTGDGMKEIIFGVRNVQDDGQSGWIDRSDAHYFAVNAWCGAVWHKTWDWSNPHVYMQPVPADVNGDGVLDVIFQDWNTIGHKPGNWEHTGPSNLFAVDGPSGNLLWRSEAPNYWSNKNVAAADVTGDGQIEVLANEVRHGDGVALYTLWGDDRGFVSAPNGWIVTKGPVVTDLDADGRFEMILPVHRNADFCHRNLDVGCREGALQVYSTPSSGSLAYSNSHLLNVNDQPDPPTGQPTQPPSDSGPSGEFSPSFENVVGNEWWIEADVGSAQPIESVHVSIEGGSWMRLDATDWGTWATSEHVPDGTVLQFQARSHEGDTATSQCYRWTDTSVTDCPQGPSGGFDANFHNVVGNEWWVETAVDTDRSLATVEASVDGGSWTSLDATGWGSWARSFHVPDGSVVQFQAVAGDGSTALSDCYRWTDTSLTECTGGSSGGGFDVSFLNVRGNEWWVETDVQSDTTVVAVDVSIDGGAWTSLESTDWGSWATSVHVPAGSDVVFRGYAPDGSVSDSNHYTWPP